MLFILPSQGLPPIADGLTLNMQFRERYERRDDADFDDSLPDNKTTWLTRGRIAMKYELDKASALNVTYQFVETRLSATTGGDTTTTGQDLVEAYVSRKSAGSTLTIGRQKVNKGAQRLIGSLEWINPSRSWLGVRMQSKEYEIFWGKLAVNAVPNFDTQLAFGSHVHSCGETMIAYKYNDKSALRQSVYMLDHRMERDFGGTIVEIEGAYQWGRTGGLDQDAWAVTARATKPLNPSVSGFVEANIATGGKSATKSHTFDNFYPTNHIYYGYMDLQGLSNMKSFAVGANWKPRSDMSLEATYHKFWLYSDTDAWYGAAGAKNGSFIDPSGASGSDVGSEIDLLWKWNVDKRSSLEAGFGAFTAGGFVEKVKGSPTDASTWGYVQYGFKF